MSVRFSRRIKICKGIHLNVSKSGVGISLGTRGASISIGSRGSYVNMGLPGTGITYRQKISEKSSVERNSICDSDIKKQEYIPDSKLKIQIDNDGKELVYMEAPDGTVFVDEEMMRRVKRSDMYREMLEKTRKAKYDYMKNKNNSCVEIFKSTPKIITEQEVLSEKNDTSEIKQLYYRVKSFNIPRPNESVLYEKAYNWALENVQNTNFWNRKRIIEETAQNRLRELFEQAKNEWILQKDSFLAQERANKARIDKQLADDYNQQLIKRNKLYELILNPDDEYLADTITDILKQIELPVDFSVDFSVLNKEIELDLDLPEIEDLPQTTCSILSTGKLSIKAKTITELNKDYAICVIGMAFFLAGIIFNISPKIEKICISGYTQRMNKKFGEIEDQYVYSINFTRKTFSELNIQNIDPLQAITNFETIIDITPKYELKTISQKKKFEIQKENNIQAIRATDKNFVSNLEQSSLQNQSDIYCFEPQEVIDNYDSNFECVALSKEVLAEKRRKRRTSLCLKILCSFLLIAAIGSCLFYYYSHADEIKFNTAFEELISSVDVSFVEEREHSNSTYYYFFSDSSQNLPETFYSSFYSLCQNKNPTIFVLNNNDDKIIDYIDLYFSTNQEIPKIAIQDCGEALIVAYNINNEQKFRFYPIKETESYKMLLEEKKQQEKLEAEEKRALDEKYNKIRRENYLYTRVQSQIYHEKINPNKGIKGNTKEKTINVTYIYAYQPKEQSAYELIGTIKKMENNPYLRIYVYSEKYSQNEIQEGEIKGNYNYDYVRKNRRAFWSFEN